MADVEVAEGVAALPRDEWNELVHAYTTAHTSAQVLAAAEELRIPSGPVGNGATVTTFDHFRARGTFVPSPSGRFVQPRVPYRISQPSCSMSSASRRMT